jgi:hypothetical protein
VTPGQRDPRPSGLTGAERLRRAARALFVVVALAAWGFGFVAGCLVGMGWRR